MGDVDGETPVQPAGIDGAAGGLDDAGMGTGLPDWLENGGPTAQVDGPTAQEDDWPAAQDSRI